MKLQGPYTAATSSSEVHVKTTITYTSSHEIHFAVGFGNPEFDYDVEVADSDERVPALTPAYRHLKENPTSWWAIYATRVLKPGESFDEDLALRISTSWSRVNILCRSHEA